MNLIKTPSWLKLSFLTFFLLPLLSACFKEKQPELPFDEVMRNVQAALFEVEFATLKFNLNLEGKDEREEIQAQAEVEFAFDRRLEAEAQQVHFNGEGKRETKEEGLKTGQLEVTLLNKKGRVREEHYVRLGTLDVTGNPEFEKSKILLQAYLGKWFKIPPELLPADYQAFLLQRDLLQEEREQAQDIFIRTKLLKLEKYHGVEKMDGRKTDHYSTTLDPAGVENYYKQLALARGDELSEEDLQQMTAGLKYVQSLELWVDQENNRILKAQLALSGKDLVQNFQGSRLAMTLKIGMVADYHTSVELTPPSEFQDLDVLLPFVQATQSPPVQGVELEEEEAPAPAGESQEQQRGGGEAPVAEESVE